MHPFSIFFSSDLTFCLCYYENINFLKLLKSPPRVEKTFGLIRTGLAAIDVPLLAKIAVYYETNDSKGLNNRFDMNCYVFFLECSCFKMSAVHFYLLNQLILQIGYSNLLRMLSVH